jgi:hypothetical protein
VELYLAAAMQRDENMMSILWAPYRRETRGLAGEELEARFADFQQDIAAGHAAFEAAKQSFELSPDPLGVALFRALRLGKGAFTIPLGTTLSDDGRTAVVRTRLNTNVDNLQLDSLPTGILVYVAGYPLGRLERISVNYEEVADKSFLAAVDIEWQLVRPAEGVGSPAGWLIESFAPDPESAVKWEPHSR